MTGQELKKLLKSEGITQVKLADVSGLHIQTIASVVAGGRVLPSTAMILTQTINDLAGAEVIKRSDFRVSSGCWYKVWQIVVDDEVKDEALSLKELCKKNRLNWNTEKMGIYRAKKAGRPYWIRYVEGKEKYGELIRKTG